jgi:hypothetical protein
MKFAVKKLFPILFFAEGTAALIWFICIPSESRLAPWLPLSLSHLLIAAVTLFFLVAAALFWFKQDALHQFKNFPCAVFQKPAVRVALILLTVFCVELFFLTFIVLPPFTRPFLIWGALVFFQGWLAARSSLPVKPLSLCARIRIQWRELSFTQRKTFWILAAISLVYFCAFIPLNSLGWNDPNRAFMSGVDEGIQYPIAVQTLTAGDTFASTVYHLLINENDVYGHPYVALEALVLLPSRVIFGADFGSHQQINLLLLRQFINVLPLLLSLFLLVYMVTRFRSAFGSVVLFLLLLSIPGVVKFNIRFLHPDAVILFLVVLTIFFLQRDKLRYGRNFYFAAVACSLAAVIKLWGFFFFTAVFVYLLVGLLRKEIPLKKAVQAGLLFIFVMFVTAVLSNPGLLVPAVFKELVNGLRGQIQNRTLGYSDLPGSGIYQKDFATWMIVFRAYYLQDFYFYFSAACLVIASLWGRRRLYPLLTLTWCATLLIFMINFLAAKSYWYAIEILVPLYPAPFLLQTLLDPDGNRPAVLESVLARPITQKIIWAIIGLICGGELAFNLVAIVTSPVILNYAH